VSLYLQAAVGAERYLLEAAWIVEIRPVADVADGEEMPCIDLRALFGADATTPGCCVLARQTAGGIASLSVDAVDGLVDIGHSEWRPLPPIGPLGPLIDAVSTKLARERPMLRVRGERVVAARFGRDTAAGAGRA
jgi:chemotaxis signal transduction protein